MKVRELLTLLKTEGLSLSDSYEVLSFLKKIPYQDAKLISQDSSIDDELITQILQLLKKSIPLSYITNRREFYGYEFYINENVLIPRIETEILIDTAKEIIEESGADNIADLFTGSGVILLTLLNEFPNLNGVGVDISLDALNVADINRKKFQLEDRAEVLNFDLSSNDNIRYLLDRYDIITANPPYIDEADYSQLEKSIQYEPKIALTSKDCGLFYYNMLLCQSTFLKGKSRHIIMEIGYNQREALAKIADSFALKYRFRKDYNGNDRVMVITIV